MRIKHLWCVIVIIFISVICLSSSNKDVKELVSCGATAELPMICPSKHSVNVVSASFRRIECKPPSILSRLRSLCATKKNCILTMDSDTLGIALDTEGSPCKDVDNCLKVGYRCLPDCGAPVFKKGIQFSGQNYAVNSNITVNCDSGYDAYYGGNVVTQVTCREDSSWSTKSLTCNDKDECRDRDSNFCDKHADCQNTVGSYICLCSDGYIGDGFTCNPSSVDRTWIAQFSNQSYGLTTDPQCGGKVFNNNGVITSPNFPGRYPDGMSCQWLITVEPQRKIMITFLSFALEERLPGEGCSQDYLTIYDGAYANPKFFLETLCGKHDQLKLITQGNQVRIKFVTDKAIGHSGFQMHFQAINPFAACDNFVEAAYEGVTILEGSRNRTVDAGGVVTIGCKDGYTMQTANQTRTCQNDNRWDDNSNPCSAARCGPPRQLNDTYGRVIGSPADFRYGGNPIQYGCASGYLLTSGPDVQTSIRCNKHGRWSNENDTELSSCQQISCLVTPDLLPPQHGLWSLYNANGTYVPVALNTTVAFDSFLIYECDSTYLPIGDVKRMCVGESGQQWSGKTILCEKDNGIPGLNNFQIALIVAILSGVVVLIVGAALIYCCVRSKEKRSRKRHHGRSRPLQERVDRTRFDNHGFTVSQVGEFVYSHPREKRDRKHRRKRRQRSNASASHHNRPHRLPTVAVMPSAPPQHQSTLNSTLRSVESNYASRTQNGGTHYSNGHRQSNTQPGRVSSNYYATHSFPTGA